MFLKHVFNDPDVYGYMCHFLSVGGKKRIRGRVAMGNGISSGSASGRVAVITGGASGVGLAAAHRAADLGALSPHPTPSASA